MSNQTVIATNVNLIRSQIASMILEHPVSEYLTDCDKKDLQTVITDPENPNNKTIFCNFINLEFRNHETEININIENSKHTLVEHEEHEDKYTKSKLQITINYPSHGSKPLDLVQKRFCFYDQVIQLSAEIDKTYGEIEIFTLISTAAEREEQRKQYEEAQRQQEFTGKIACIVAKNNNRMQINTVRLIKEVYLGKEPGFFVHHNIGNKKYAVVVVSSSEVCITRIE